MHKKQTYIISSLSKIQYHTFPCSYGNLFTCKQWIPSRAETMDNVNGRTKGHD